MSDKTLDALMKIGDNVPIRIAATVFLTLERDGYAMGDSMSSFMQDVDMHDNPAEELAKIFDVEIPDYLIDAIEESDDPMFFADIFLNDFICDSQLHGILIKAETPMKKNESAVPGTTVATCNWGSYHSKWIYCESTADIAKKLAEFTE